jgi:hypothetical protein
MKIKRSELIVAWMRLHVLHRRATSGRWCSAAWIVLELDATDDSVHGHQLGRCFHGYYNHYCYLPLYLFCGEYLTCARLRPLNIDTSAGSVKELDPDRLVDPGGLAASTHSDPR